MKTAKKNDNDPNADDYDNDDDLWIMIGMYTFSLLLLYYYH